MHQLASRDVLMLAFDTATPAATVALADGDRVLASYAAVDPRRHGEHLAPGVQSVLAEAGVRPDELERIAVGVGPGPFTGLRVGLATARAMGAALGVPVRGVCTLDVLAAGSDVPAGRDAAGSGELLVATDARRREVYWARYRRSADSPLGVTRLDGPHVTRPAEITWDGPVVGQGAVLYPDDLGEAVPPAHADAAVLARLVAYRLTSGGEIVDPVPLYLRRPDAVAPGPRKRVTA